MKGFSIAFVVVLAITVAGCENFEEHNAFFDAYNKSGHPVIVIINGTEQVRIEAHQSRFFETQILVPSKPFGSPTAAHTVDQPVNVSVAFKNLGTGELSPAQICQSGAKVITTLEYHPSGSTGYVTCYPKR